MFPHDKRLRYLAGALRGAFPRPLRLPRASTQSDHDYIAAQQAALALHSRRTASAAVGRGMVTAGTAEPTVTDPIPVPVVTVAMRAGGAADTLLKLDVRWRLHRASPPPPIYPSLPPPRQPPSSPPPPFLRRAGKRCVHHLCGHHRMARIPQWLRRGAARGAARAGGRRPLVQPPALLGAEPPLFGAAPRRGGRQRGRCGGGGGAGRRRRRRRRRAAQRFRPHAAKRRARRAAHGPGHGRRAGERHPWGHV
jgi:hypothetical protein